MLTKRSTLFKAIVFIPVFLLLVSGLLACGSKSGNALFTGKGINKVTFTPLTVLSSVVDNVIIFNSGTNDQSNGKDGMTLGAGDKIKTDSDGRATITFFDGSRIELDSNTEISLDELVSKSDSSSKIIKIGQEVGETTSRVVKLVDPASRYEIQTPSAVAAVRGSVMTVQVTADGATKAYNVEGNITLTAQGQEVAIPTGSSSTALPGKAPAAPQPGLPPVIDFSNTTSISSKIGWQQTGLHLNTGDKYFIDYKGGSWTVDYRNFPYVGLAGYTSDVDKTISPGSNAKVDTNVPYACLLGKVGNGKELPVGNSSGPFTADADGYLFPPNQ